ncbi:tyrosine-type recombinase/integrase [Lutibacter sp.]|uniref:tyrosine-type recombinase/integrase n=1 Tax=Lutibacter sp. TaxID=1925666 RepID=UPI0034A064A9
MSYPIKAKGSKTRPKRLPIDINEDEFGQILENTPKRRHRVAFLMAFGSGLRLSEVINLEPRDFDFETNQLKVREGKGKKDRIVPIPKGFKEEFLHFIPFEFENRSLQKAFKRACEKAGIFNKKPSATFHSLRHGFATTCLRKGISLRAIQRMLGHSDLSTTGMYLDLCPDEILKEYQEKF